MTKSYSSEAVTLADTILKASGSNLKNYTMQLTRDAILGAAQKPFDERDELEDDRKELQRLNEDLHSRNVELLTALKEVNDGIEKLLDSEHAGITSDTGKDLQEMQVLIAQATGTAGAA